MRETRSALEELAERITEVLAYYQDDMYLEHRQTIDMAQRIVEKLAKVKGESVYSPHGYKVACRDAYEDCRAIAEEVVRDDK